MRLWQIPFSTNVERVALALGHKGLDAEPVVVDPADRSAVVALSGQELLPVPQGDDGRGNSRSPRNGADLESVAPAPSLYPADPARRAEQDAVIDWFDRVWKGPPNWLEAALSAGRDPEEPELRAWSDALRGSLERFERLLQGRNFLFGQA